MLFDIMLGIRYVYITLNYYFKYKYIWTNQSKCRMFSSLMQKFLHYIQCIRLLYINSNKPAHCTACLCFMPIYSGIIGKCQVPKRFHFHVAYTYLLSCVSIHLSLKVIFSFWYIILNWNIFFTFLFFLV